MTYTQAVAKAKSMHSIAPLCVVSNDDKSFDVKASNATMLYAIVAAEVRSCGCVIAETFSKTRYCKAHD